MLPLPMEMESGRSERAMMEMEQAKLKRDKEIE